MINKKTRYLQLNDVMMFEYIMKTDTNDGNDSETLYFTKLLDNHYCTFWPNNYETEFVNGKAVLNKDKVKSYNTLNHMAVPKDRKCSEWYAFIDDTYEYSEEDELNSLKAEQYMKYMNPTDDSDNVIHILNISSKLGYDEVRLYFATGYDFSDIFGILCRLYVETDYVGSEKKTNPQFIDLCNFFITKGTWFRLIKYLTEPVIFGSTIYDRYISINVPSLRDIWNPATVSNTDVNNPNSILHIRENAPIHIMMASIEDDYKFSRLTTKTENTLRDTVNDNTVNDKTNTLVNCEFSRTSNLNGAIPSETITSDRLGTYIAVNDDYNCIEYCMTWQDSYGNVKPLTKETVSLFNNSISLYDRSLIKTESVYEVNDDYDVNDNLGIKNWVILHKITLTYIDNDMGVNKTETYTMTQTFEAPEAESVFYYRPFITNPELIENISVIAVEYSARLMNTRDMVQFLNEATLNIGPTELYKYYYNNAKIMIGDSNTDVFASITPYKIYNKIVESKQELNNNSNLIGKTKYIKVFYNSTDVVLESTDGMYYTSGNIELTLSPAPKNYKFVIKYRKSDSVYDYMDLSDGYYKLYTKDAANNDIVIEPTYSSNMNLLLGELEFSIDTKTLNKLMSVDSKLRRMSIVSYNNDNSVSSLFDFTYNF